MMSCDERDIKCHELRKIFREFIIPNSHCDYTEAKLKEDAPDEVKKAHEEYIKLKKEIYEDRAKLPFV